MFLSLVNLIIKPCRMKKVLTSNDLIPLLKRASLIFWAQLPQVMLTENSAAASEPPTIFKTAIYKETTEVN
jgi:hypothetical protein